MTNPRYVTADAFLGEIGGRLARVRLDRNLTQRELADQAGVSKRTVERLESGAAATQLSGFIRVCRALGLLERFDALVPDSLPSPIAQVKLRGRLRRRASSAKTPAPSSKKWTWGDES
jgi:transcriptional regulator with XRE-family HTH domain